MSTTVFEITRPPSKTTSRFAGKHALRPGHKVLIPITQVTTQLVIDVMHGEFTSTPDIPKDGDAGDGRLSEIVAWINAHNATILFEPSGSVTVRNHKKHGVHVGQIVVRDHAGVSNFLADGLKVRLEITPAPFAARFDSVTGPTEKTLEIISGYAPFKIVALERETEITVRMTDVDGHGLDVSAELKVMFE